MTTQEIHTLAIPAKNENLQKFSWKEYLILALAGLFGSIASIPSLWTYILDTAATKKIPVQLLLGEQIVQSALWMLLAVGVGLLLAGRTGLGAPILRSRLNGEAVSGKVRAQIFPSVSLALLATILVKVLDLGFFLPRMPGFSTAISQVSGWKGLLASFYGGITEEILTRLFLLTLLAWILSWFSHTKDNHLFQAAM